MTRRVRDALLGVALALVTLAGAMWQVEQSSASEDAGGESLPRLICPLH